MEREGRRQGEGPGPHQCSSSLKEPGSGRLAPGLHAVTQDCPAAASFWTTGPGGSVEGLRKSSALLPVGLL